MIDASPCYFRTYVTEQGRFLRPNSNFGRQNPLLTHFFEYARLQSYFQSRSKTRNYGIFGNFTSKSFEQ